MSDREYRVGMVSLLLSIAIILIWIIVITEMSRWEFIDDYDLGIKNHLKCYNKQYSVKKMRSDIVSFDYGEITFKGRLTVRTIDCYWLDHHTDDYSKLKDK